MYGLGQFIHQNLHDGHGTHTALTQASSSLSCGTISGRGFWGDVSPFAWQPGVYLPERLVAEEAS